MAGPAEYVAERFALPSTRLRVDREKCVVYGIRVIGPRSRMRHKYPEAYQRSAVTQMDGAPCYWGHHYDPQTMRPVEAPPEKKLGIHTNPRYEDGGTHTDLRYNPKNQHAEEFLWACENAPEMLSFSQLAKVVWRRERDADGDRVAESCLEFASGDVVSEGGATSTIFESFTREARMAAGPPDPKEVAGSLESPGQMIDWLTGFFASLKGIDQPTKDQLLQTAVQALTAGQSAPADAADQATAAPAMESLRRLGPVGRWAAARLDGVFVAEALRKRRAWADELIAAERLPDHLKSDVFVETVAESYGNPDRARKLIDDRRQLGGGDGKGGPTTTPAGGGGKKSIKDIAAEYAAG